MTEIAFFLDDQTSHDFVELSSLLGEEEQVTHPCSDIESTIAVKDEMRQYETLPEFNFYHPIENAMKGVATIEGTTSPSEYMNGRLPLEPACVSPTPSTTIFDQTNHGSFPLLPDVNARANQEVCEKVVQTATNSSRKRKSQGYDDREEEQVGGHLKQKDRRREKNREHAKKSRSKKKDLTKHLEESVLILKKENQKLKELVCLKLSATQEDTEKMIKDRIVTPTDRFIACLKKPSNRILSNSTISYLKSLSTDCVERFSRGKQIS